ncbi:hypothetical protein [Caballeronia cordobensis]|uniref:hypothetical protein n=1 Tax=Caballeronia cordobensis TaxID=1353886 RepID=UPI0006AD6563|nr:hypothetical protein [Caballeronia cordobensis]
MRYGGRLHISPAATLAASEGGTAFLIEWIDEMRTYSDLVVDTVARCPGPLCDALDGALHASIDGSSAIGATTPWSNVIAIDLDFANYLSEVAHVGVVHGSAVGVETHVRCASRMLFRCPRRATRAGAHRDRVCGVDTPCRRGLKRLSTRRHPRGTYAVRGFSFFRMAFHALSHVKTLPPIRRNSARCLPGL